mmetsp:Transcript_21631/g.69941  ORF Transcript_21631/g.69941 Transcript_21631/m.69941 type:complete len:333 (-) Transcript_21631:93-1091(-)
MLRAVKTAVWGGARTAPRAAKDSSTSRRAETVAAAAVGGSGKASFGPGTGKIEFAIEIASAPASAPAQAPAPAPAPAAAPALVAPVVVGAGVGASGKTVFGSGAGKVVFELKAVAPKKVAAPKGGGGGGGGGGGSFLGLVAAVPVLALLYVQLPLLAAALAKPFAFGFAKSPFIAFCVLVAGIFVIEGPPAFLSAEGAIPAPMLMVLSAAAAVVALTGYGFIPLPLTVLAGGVAVIEAPSMHDKAKATKEAKPAAVEGGFIGKLFGLVIPIAGLAGAALTLLAQVGLFVPALSFKALTAPPPPPPPPPAPIEPEIATVAVVEAPPAPPAAAA